MLNSNPAASAAPQAPARKPEIPLPTSTQKIADYSELVKLAGRGLERMFDGERQRFCHTMRRARGTLQRESVSPRYTLMTLLGLRRLEQAAGKSPVDVAGVLGRMTEDLAWIDGAGDLGLLLWAVAVIAPQRFDEIAEQTGARDALRRYKDAGRGYTMELAWYLTGVTCGMLEMNTRPGAFLLAEQADEAFRRLAANQGARGIFGHLTAGKSLAGTLRGKIGSFADQVYPIYALARFSRVTANASGKEALERARECARTICEHQGPNGEWWWHYDFASGRVAESYPVYSVHQDGMAPMALFALAEAAGEDFTAPIRKGLAWISGQNDLQIDMRNLEEGVIWRCLYLPRTERLLRQLLGSDHGSERVPVEKLKVNFECRPYELGWALYALAGK